MLPYFYHGTHGKHGTVRFPVVWRAEGAAKIQPWVSESTTATTLEALPIREPRMHANYNHANHESTRNGNERKDCCRGRPPCLPKESPKPTPRVRPTAERS